MARNSRRSLLSLLLCAAMALQLMPAVSFAAPERTASQPALQSTSQVEPAVTVRDVAAQAQTESGDVFDVTVKEYTYTFTTVPETYEDIVQYKLDNPYKTMALMILAYRTWTPSNPNDCLRMLDYLTDTGATLDEEPVPFSRYNPWIEALKDRMTQNNKYRYIGNAYLKGAKPSNNYTPDTPITITLRQSVYDPYKQADEWGPLQKQVLIFLDGAENERYSLFSQASNGDWKVSGRSWINLLADVQPMASDYVWAPEYTVPAHPAHPQKEPTLSVTDVPALAPGIDENGEPCVIETTVKEYTYTFSTVPETYEDIIQYKLDSPYKTMALLAMAYRTWKPDNETDCLEMLNYLTNTGVDSGKTDAQGHKIAKNFSDHQPAVSFVRDRMKQNEKYRYIGNNYLNGATPENDYTPKAPYSVTLRESVYVPYVQATPTTPELQQIFIRTNGADSDRYCAVYQDERGDWRIWSDYYKSLLADVRKPWSDILFPPEYERPKNPANPQVEPEVTVYDVPAKAVGTDDKGNEIIIDTTVKQYTFTFSTIPTCYEDIVQYKLDSPYKAMALLILAYRTWTPENKTDCMEMMDYLTNTNSSYGNTVDSQGHKTSQKASTYNPWIQFVTDRMRDKYQYIGNAYCDGAMPSNDYTPSEPLSITVRQSVYDPYTGQSSSSDKVDPSDPTLYQVLTTIPGADNDRYAIFYQDQRGDYRVFSDFWKGLLANVKTPSSDIPWPAEVIRSSSPAHPQTEPKVTVTDVPGKAPTTDGGVMDVTVKQYSYTFSTIPTCYEDIVQYKLDSPYKTMALLALAFRTWTPENQTDCEEMLSYLTNTATEKPGAKDAQGHKLCYPFQEYNPWKSFLYDRMTQNDKYRFIGNAYLNGASPDNNYTPSTPITVTVRQSVYDPYREADGNGPLLKQVLISIDGADNDRYSLFYEDQRGDWRVFGDNWKGLLADVKEQAGDKTIPYKPDSTGSTLTPTVKETTLKRKAVSVDGEIIDVPIKRSEISFPSGVSTPEEVNRYKLDTPEKTIALMIMAFRTWTPKHPETCWQMLDGLTDTGARSGKTDAATGRPLTTPFSGYEYWKQFLKDRMTQNDKYKYIGNAYLNGSTPDNNYTPSTPYTVTVRESPYAPYAKATATTPALYQYFVKVGGGNERYVLMYKDDRGDWRVWSDSWKGLLVDIIGITVSIDKQEYDKSSGDVTFEAENATGLAVPFVAIYNAKGQMTGVIEAAQAQDGSYLAPVGRNVSNIRIFAPSEDSFAPVCDAEEIN